MVKQLCHLPHRPVSIALHLHQGQWGLHRGAIGIGYGAVAILPSLVPDPPRGAGKVFQIAIAIEIAIAFHPLYRQLSCRQDFLV